MARASRRQGLHTALYVAAECARDGELEEQGGNDALAITLERIADCIYYKDEREMLRLFKQYGATNTDLKRDSGVQRAKEEKDNRT